MLAFDTYHVNSDWWAFYAVFDLPDFQASPLWIAERLDLEVGEVVMAL